MREAVMLPPTLPEEIVVFEGKPNAFNHIFCCHRCCAFTQQCFSALLLLLLLLVC